MPPMPSPRSTAARTIGLLPSLAVAALTLGALACGGGSKSTGATQAAAPPFTLSAASLTLPVPPAANQSQYPIPYVGTVTFTVNRTAGFTDPVTLAFSASALPTGVKAAFADATIPAGGTTATLSIQAGYPDPSDPTFTRQIYPASLGTFTIPVTATSGATTEGADLTLTLDTEPATFAVAFVDQAADAYAGQTNINLPATGATTEYLLAYENTGAFDAPYGPITMSLKGVPENLSAAFDGIPFYMTDSSPHTLTLTPQPGLAAGIYAFDIVASYLGQTQTLPVIVTYGPAPFSLQAPIAASVSVAQGQVLTLPFHLWHDDAYFGTTQDYTTTDPLYVGSTALSVNGGGAGAPQATWATASLDALASAPLAIDATSATPGTYTLNLVATRNGGATPGSATRSLAVTVTPASASPTLWIQDVEWGQTTLAPNLNLVSGKPALLRVLLAADRAGVQAPAVTATVTNAAGATVDSVTLQGPATVPTTIVEGDLPTATAPSGSSYTAVLPLADLQPGLSVAISAGTASATVKPTVTPGTVMNLTVVPVYVQGVAPVLPATTEITRELTAFWPVQGVTLVQRAPYVTTTVIPAPSNANTLSNDTFDAWGELLSELNALRIVDGGTANYYGIFNPGYTEQAVDQYGAILGLSVVGEGIGVGIDATAANQLVGWGFQNYDPEMNLATEVMVHEEGHAFGLNHAPAGGAASPQLDYPYAGAATGSWGFDPVAMTAYAPTGTYDIMSYASDQHWVSDWDYLNALGFITETQGGTAFTADAQTGADQYVVGGWIGPDNRAHLAPLVQVACPARAPRAGDLKLVLKTAAGTRTIPFSAAPVPDLPAGYRHFAFTVPASTELLSARIQVPGAPPTLRPQGLLRTRTLAARTQALGAAAATGSLVIRETPGSLHLAWDAQAHPYVNVLHEGAARTTLALHLQGGAADVPLAGLPAGGRFILHYSDGLNTVTRTVERTSR